MIQVAGLDKTPPLYGLIHRVGFRLKILMQFHIAFICFLLQHSYLTHSTTAMYYEQPRLVTRLVSMLLDHIFMCVITIVPMWIIVFMSMAGDATPEPMGAVFQFAFLGILILYFLKDSFQGRSAAKRMMKLQVVDLKTGMPASAGQCFVRNLPIILWPIEVIMTLVNRQRRMGDYIAGTKVVNYDPAAKAMLELELSVNQ